MANLTRPADLLRSLIERIELTPKKEDFEINLYGDLAGILSLAANKNRPLTESDPSVQQVKVVAGARNHRELTPLIAGV